MKEPTVSIILPTYNRAYILRQSIGSVLSQSFTDFELLIIDDCSTDDTSSIVSSINDSRITYLKTPVNSGAAAARNYGISLAQGKYIAFEDSDDMWLNNKLELQLNLMEENPECGFSYHKIYYDMGKNNHGQNLFVILPDEKIPYAQKNGDIFTQLLYDNLVGCPTMLIRHDALSAIGTFDTELKALEDYDLAIRLAKKYPALFIDEVLVSSTFSTTGVSGSPINYLTASCMILYKYKNDYISSGMLSHRIEAIINDSKTLGLEQQFKNLLEKILS